jgi:hypothetical protein
VRIGQVLLLLGWRVMAVGELAAGGAWGSMGSCQRVDPFLPWRRPWRRCPMLSQVTKDARSPGVFLAVGLHQTVAAGATRGRRRSGPKLIGQGSGLGMANRVGAARHLGEHHGFRSGNHPEDSAGPLTPLAHGSLLGPVENRRQIRHPKRASHTCDPEGEQLCITSRAAVDCCWPWPLRSTG